MKKRFIVSLILVIVLALSFCFSACAETSETPHDHSWSTEWTKNYVYHWHAPLCADTAEIKDRAEHNFVNGACSDCGYIQIMPHEHIWSTEWTKNNMYHWHAPLCADTAEIKDRAEHSIADGSCTVCGYHLTVEDVYKKYDTVVQPIYDAAETILNDLVKSGEFSLNGMRNPRITSIRFYFGKSFTIFIQEDLSVTKNGEKSEFLQRETGITLENFSETYSDAFLAYTDFIRKEYNSQNLANYEEVVLSYARKSAEKILEQYEIYKKNPEKEISIGNFGKQLNLRADSSLSEVYEKIVANLNSAIEKRGCPLITNQVLDISFGGNIYWDVVHRWIIIETSVGSMSYSFYLSFNKNGEFSEDYINYFLGTMYTGYEWSDPNQLNPKNEEYADLFGRLKIEEYDLSDIQNSYGYDGVGCALFASYENTFIYFNNPRKN